MLQNGIRNIAECCGDGEPGDESGDVGLHVLCSCEERPIRAQTKQDALSLSSAILASGNAVQVASDK